MRNPVIPGDASRLGAIGVHGKIGQGLENVYDALGGLFADLSERKALNKKDKLTVEMCEKALRRLIDMNGDLYCWMVGVQDQDELLFMVANHDLEFRTAMDPIGYGE